MPSFRILYLISLLIFTEAGPVSNVREQSTCAVQCLGNNNKFNYQIGTVYEFSYDAKTTTKMNGASEDSARIDMNAKVEIEALTKCDLVMRITDASLRDSEDDQNSQAFKEAMLEQPLKFSFQDGRIDHICAMDGESTWTLNIKRGILSAFQNSMDNFDRNQNLTETDVVGSCDSEYKILDEGRRIMLVEKTKNLLGCSDREGYRLSVQSIGYNVPSFVKSLPLMKSEYKCTQTLDLGSNILQSSTCSEEHVFRPFSSGNNGAMTSSEQTLTFTNKKRAGRPSNEHFSQRSTLLFHHQYDTSSKQDKEEKIEAKLEELCQKATEDIRPEVPEMVNQLIEHMRQVDRDVLSRVYTKINRKSICASKADRIKQYFHDAIPMVGTEASVGMIQDLISKKHVTGSEAEMWLLSLSFVHHPSKEMVAAVMPLLEERDVSGNILLAVSSLASSYCNERPDCGKDSEISALIRKLMDLTHDCNDQNGDARKIVFALRALGNIGHSHEAVSHLSRCFTRPNVREEIRIAAMDAFRRIPCDAVRSDLMGVFRDESEDSELRINAYIGLMKCPSRNILSEVRQVLEKEKSNQVGSFVWSHLTNLMETSDPHMQDIRNIVQDEELKKEFNLDQRKFSRNYEGSFFFDSINTGAKVDSNVIFSQKSFIPRSANLNLTIDLFGHAINFLEFGGRVQGMEKFLEHFFGPTGVKEPKMKAENTPNFDKNMDMFRSSAFLRVFGNELRYWDDKSLSELQSSLQRLMRMQALSFSKTMVLLDSRMIIPTCVGLPLNLTMSATGSISIDAKASFQQRNFLMNIDFKPSASVQVKGEMSVDAHVSRAGLKMITVAHTSTGARLDIGNNKFDLQIPEKKMEIFNLKTDFYIVHRNTEKKQKMIVDNVKKHEVCTGKLMKQVTGLTFCQIIKFPKASHHNEAPFFPFTGPVVYDLYMMNEDAPNGYQIEGFTKESPYSFYIDTPNSKVSRRFAIDTVMKNKNEAHITFKAPWKNIKIEGTVVNMDNMKKLTGKMSINDRTEYSLGAEVGMKNARGMWSFTPKFEITIPQKTMKYEGKVEINPMKTLLIDMSAMGFIDSDINLKVSGEIVPKEIGLTSQLRIGKKEYYMASRLGRLVSKTGFKYSPSLKITIPNKDIVEFTSEILYESNKKMSFDFKLNKVLPKTVAMNAIVLLNAGKTKTKNILKVLFKSPRGNFRIIGDVDNKKTGITSRVIGSYNFGAKYSDRLTLSSKIRDLSVKKSVRYMGNIGLASKKQVFLNFNLKGQLAKADNHLETKFDLHYGNPKIKTNNLKFDCVLNRALKPFSHAYDYTMAIQHPGQKMDYRIDVHHLQSAPWPFKKIEQTVMVQLAAGNVVKTSLSYSNGKEKGLPCYKAEASLSYPGKDMTISEKLVQLGPKSLANYLTVQWQKRNHIIVYSSFNKTRNGIYNAETTVNLAGENKMKFNGMMHSTVGAYKAKASLEADAGLLSQERINYMAKAGLHYKLKATEISSDASLDIKWAEDKNASASFNLKYAKDTSLSSRIILLTSSELLKSFETKVKWGWGKDRFSAILYSSFNNKFHVKEDLSFSYSNFLLTYNLHIDVPGKVSDIVIDLNESSFMTTISQNNEILIDLSMRFREERSNVQRELQLSFNLFATSGKIEMSIKFEPKQQGLELKGSATFQLPLQQLRQMGASYNLKHNNDLSSIDMSFSSSLRNYRNGKLSVEMKRKLPKMLKATMEVTLNGNPMFKLDANYGRQRDNFDMKVDMTDASGKQITASGNVNFSGNRKTVNVEMKSSFVEFSADGAFEYQSTRSAGAELKMTLNGKNVMMRANYEKEGTTYKATGTLRLTDGRSLQMEGSLDLENIAASLKTMSPDFPQLTQIDMSFSFNGDERMFRSTVSLKVMPYFDTTQVEMKSNKKQFSIEMKSKFESMKQAKITVILDGDWVRSQKVKSVFQLDNEQMFEFDMNYNFNSVHDFTVSLAALTSHRRYKELQFDLKNKGPLNNIQSSLKLKLSNVITFDGMFQNSRTASKLSLDTQILDFDEWKSTFELKGDLDFMTASIITSIGKQKVNKIEASLKQYGRLINVKVNGPNAVNFDFNMNLDTETITFNMASTFTVNGRETYEMSASYEHLSKLEIKTSIPSYKDELLITFSGPMKAFNMHTKFSHNDLIYELMLSNKEYYRQIKATLNTPYFQDTALFKFDGPLSDMNILAQVMHNNDKFQLTFSNSGYYKQIDAKLDTPYFQDTALFKVDGPLSDMNMLAQVMHNNDKFQLTFSNSGYYKQIDANLDTPYFQPTLKFSLIGNPKKFNFECRIQFDKHTYEMKASNDEYFQKLNIKINMPKFNCNFTFDKTGLSFYVRYAKAKCELKIKMQDNFVFSLHFRNLHFINFPMIVNMSSPSISSSAIKLLSLEEGKIELSSSAKGENKLTLLLQKSSDQENKMNATLSFQSNSLFSQQIKCQIFAGNNQVSNIDLDYNIERKEDLSVSLNLKTSHSRFDEVSLLFKHQEDLPNSESILKVKVGRELMLDSEFKQLFTNKQISVEASLKIFDGTNDHSRAFPARELSSTFSFNTKHKMSINAMIKVPEVLDFEIKSEINQDKTNINLRSILELHRQQVYKIAASYEHMTKLQVRGTVSSYNGELTMTMDGNEKIFNTHLKLKLSNVLTFDAMFQNSRRVSKLSVDTQLLDFDEWQSTFELKSDLDFMTASIITSIGKKEVNKIEASLKQYGRLINVKVNGPNAVNFDFNMNLDTETITFNMASTFTVNGWEKYEMFASYEHLSKLEIKTSIPSYKDELLITFSGPMKAFNMHTKFSHNDLIYELMLSNKEYYHQIKATLNTPYFQDTALFKVDGPLSDMNILAQVMHNNDKFQLTFSNSGYYKQIDAKLDTPYFQPTLKVSLIGNPKKFNFECRIQFDKHTYEMKASNEEYFRKMNIKINIPKFNCNFMFDKTGLSLNVRYSKAKFEMKMKMQDDLELVFYLMNPGFIIHSNLEQEEIYKIVATYEHLAKLSIKTSFPSYKDELTMTLNGDFEMFNALVKLTHNTNKYELIISNQGYYRKIDAQLITPFSTDMASFIFNGDEETFNSQAKFMHENRHYGNKQSLKMDSVLKFDWNMKTFYSNNELTFSDKVYKLTIESLDHYRNINAELNIPFFSMDAVFKIEGNRMLFNSRANLREEKLFDLSMTMRDYFHQMSITLSTRFSPKLLMFHLKLSGNNVSLNASMTPTQKTYRLTVETRATHRNINVDIFSFLVSISFHRRASSPGSFDLTAQVKNPYNHCTLAIIKDKSVFKLNANLTLPFMQDAIQLNFNRQLQSFNCLAQLVHNGEEFRLAVSTLNQYRQIKAELITPYFKESLVFLLNGTRRKFNVQLTLKHNDGLYEMKASNRDFYRQMDFQISTPFIRCRLESSIEMAKKSFLLTIDEDKYELNIYNKKSFQFNEITLSTPQHKLQITSKMYRKKKSLSAVIKVQFDGRTFILTGLCKDATPKYILNANIKTPTFTASLHSSSVDKSRKASTKQKPWYEKYIYDTFIHSKNIYNDLDFNFKKSGMKAKFAFKGNLQKSKIISSLKMATDLYEVNVSKQKYFETFNIEVTSPQMKLTSNLQNNANHFDFNTEITFIEINKKYILNISNKNQGKERVLKFVGPQINVNGHLNGDLKSFSFDVNILFRNEKYEMMAATNNYLREISAKMGTPQFGEQRLLVKINGQLSDFNGFIEVKNNNEVYRSDFSLTNNEFRLSLPKLLKKLQVKLNGNWKNFEFIMQLMDYSGERIEISADKNFKELKAHLVIPKLKDIEVFVKTSGNLRNGAASMKMSYGENMFENEIEISFDGSQASFKLEPHYKILGRSGKSKLKIDLMFEAQSYKYEFEADIEGTQVKSMASMKISSEVSILMTINIPTFDASEMKLRIVSEGFQKIDMMLNLKSPWTGMTKIFYEHNSEMGSSLGTKGYVERDGKRLAGYLLDMKAYNFDFKCDHDNYRNIFEIKSDLKFQGRKTMASLSLKTPFQILSELFLSAEMKMLRDKEVTVELNVKSPNQEYRLNIDLSNSNVNGLLNVNMDKKNKDKQYQFQTSYKNTDQRADVSRSFNIKIVLPERTVSLGSRFENTQHSMVMSSHLMWDESRDQKIGFELMVQKGRENEAKLRVITPRRTIELFGRVQVNDNHYSTMGHIIMDIKNQAQKVDIKADITKSSDRADIDLTVKFPNQKKGMNLKTSVNIPNGDIIFSSTSEFSVDQDPQKTFKMSTKLMSESKGKREMYTMQMSAGHANTGFATEMIGRVSKSPDKYNADVEMGYLNLKRKQQKFAIRGEMHRLNREVNLKLEAPSKTVELDGSLRNGNRYMMSVLKKESGKENMEALFKLNPNSQRLNIIFNYDEENPDKMYRIDAEVIKSKTLLKAYRTNKNSNLVEDAALQVEIKPKNILMSSIRWNPRLFQEFHTFAYEKLSVYGREMKYSGDSLRQALNGEISMKFALAKRSFSEEMVPIIDYFNTEYRSMSADFEQAMRHMKQIIDQDSFYVKSAMEAITNAYDEMWFNFNNYLIQLRHEIQQFNHYMNNRMDEAKKEFDFYYGKYSMQLTNKVNELLDDCRHHCEILYKQAMEMKAEIVSFVNNYPNSIKELIDGMRQNPYGEKVIDILMSMYQKINEKTVQAKDHMNTLTNSIYSAHAILNRNIAKVKQYPIVDAIMDPINEVYQQALWSYRYFDVKDNVLGLWNTLYKVGAEKIKEIKDIVTDIGMNTLVFDPKRGEIIVRVRFGAAKYAYNHFMSSVEDVKRAVMKLSNLMPNIDFNVWDIYYMMKPSSDLYDNIPPFKAEASLFVGHHITTFDGRHLNYKGTCSYLLARDFVDGNFTVVANFDADRTAKTLKSLSVTTAHNEQVEIFPDSKVFFNNRLVKLPLQLTDATVTRQGNQTVVQSKRGYKVVCDHDIELYTVQISGWYFNKMAGLFGNYNNEPMDDMLMPNNRYTNDLEQFVESWSVSRQCPSHRNFAPNHMVPENRECAHFFLQTDSPYHYCFKQVNPSQFYKTCAMQLSSSKATSIDLCKVTSFYLRTCETKGVHLSMPSMCPRKM